MGATQYSPSNEMGYLARFRIGIFTWPGKSMSLRDIGSDISLHGAKVSLN